MRFCERSCFPGYIHCSLSSKAAAQWPDGDVACHSTQAAVGDNRLNTGQWTQPALLSPSTCGQLRVKDSFTAWGVCHARWQICAVFMFNFVCVYYVFIIILVWVYYAFFKPAIEVTWWMHDVNSKTAYVCGRDEGRMFLFWKGNCGRILCVDSMLYRVRSKRTCSCSKRL